MQLFPYAQVRDEQDRMLDAIRQTVDRGEKLVVHAPTGLGKTAAALTPAIEHALQEKKVVMFLTSRLTQHKLALQTVREMRERHDVQIPVVDMIGKKHMCLQKNVESLSGKEFAEYCKAMREDGLCEYYERLRKGEELSPTTRSVLVQIGKRVVSPDEVKGICDEAGLCPYEVTGLLARQASVIIADYSYLFNPRIRSSFFHRIGKTLEDCIVIVDEGHNLPDRVKDLATERITGVTLGRAIKELDDEHERHVRALGEQLERLALKTDGERFVGREEFLDLLAGITDVDAFVRDLHAVGKRVREEQKASSAAALAEFIEAWHGPDDGYARILSVERDSQTRLGKAKVRWSLSYRCLDPAVVTKDVFQDCASAVVMSGTLSPVGMYAEILGLQSAEQLSLASPFPRENRMNLIVPKTTTKYKRRSDDMYERIGEVCSELADAIPGNLAIFLPSYALLDRIHDRIRTSKTILAERPGMTREEREGLLMKFRSQLHAGTILLGVMSGSFGEGIDLPGDELRGVVIVGLPLGRPDLETKALIDHYQDKFGRGWDYGYVFPAFTRTLQSAGRCIRSETDRGVIVFLDERYTWPQYYKCFPDELHARVTLKYDEMIRGFFDG